MKNIQKFEKLFRNNQKKNYEHTYKYKQEFIHSTTEKN